MNEENPPGDSFWDFLKAFLNLRHDKVATTNRPGTLIERNQDLIAKRVSLIAPSGDAKYIENQVRFCIIEIAGREGKPHLAREREWLSQWEQRLGIPVEYRELKTHLLSVFSARHAEIWRQKELAERKRREDLKHLKHEELLARNQDLIVCASRRNSSTHFQISIYGLTVTNATCATCSSLSGK